jgi:hypothetical protein
VAALALVITYVGGGAVVSEQEARAFYFALPGIFLSMAAFGVAPKEKSVFVSALLVVNGVILTADGLMVSYPYLASLYFTGPVIGFFFALVVLALGIVKSVMTGIRSV